VECVEGPFKGYYITAYAAAAGDGGYVAYAKVCRAKPQSYWDADCLLKDATAASLATQDDALNVAIALSKHQIEQLPHFSALPLVYLSRSIQGYERSTLGLYGA
jgi:hypothetical protein